MASGRAPRRSFSSATSPSKSSTDPGRKTAEPRRQTGLFPFLGTVSWALAAGSLLVLDLDHLVLVVALAEHLGLHDRVADVQRIHDALARQDAAEDRVLPVEPVGGEVGDEELGPVGVGPGVGH